MGYYGGNPPSDVEKRIQFLKDKVEKLEARVRKLEEQSAQTKQTTNFFRSHANSAN